MTTQIDNKTLKRIGMEIDKHAILYRGETEIIRAVNPKFDSFYGSLLSNKVIQSLVEKGILINTQKSSVEIDRHDLILEHPIIPTISYPFEWTPSMFKDAAILILKLNLELMKEGFCTQDAHPWNVLFDGSNPKFVDFTSIIKLPGSKRWSALEEFKSYCLNSLLLMSYGHTNLARAIMRDVFSSPSNDLIQNLRPGYNQNIYQVTEKVKRLSKKISSKLGIVSDGLNDVRQLLKIVESIDVSPSIGEWSEYYSGKNALPIYNGSSDSVADLQQSSPKHERIYRLLESLKPEKVLDIGCNRGLYSQMAAKIGAHVVGIDMDEQALDQMYLDSKNMSSNVLPLFVNSVAPAEAIGFTKRPFLPVTERLRADCAICLALVHHLVFKRTQMSFAHIAELLDTYSTKSLIVEFVPKEDEYVSQWYSEEFSWYSCDSFIDELRKFYKTVEVFESFPKPRILLFCQK